MKKKKILSLLFVCLLLIQTDANGQNITIKTGMNFSDIFVSSAAPDTTLYLGNAFGARIGCETRFEFAEFYGLIGGIYLSQRKVDQKENNVLFEYRNKTLVNYMDAPITLFYKIPLGNTQIRIKGGLMSSIAISGDENGFQKYFDSSNTSLNRSWDNKIDVGGSNDFKRFDFSYNFGISIDYKRVEIGVNYSKSIGDIIDDISAINKTLTSKWDILNLMIGYKI